MPNMNVSAAWVNTSSSTITVYSNCTTVRPGGTNGAGGSIIGSIYPKEFYCTAPRDSTAQNVDYAKIYFRNSSGVMTLGYIEPQPGGIATGYETWYDLQSHYINYNSNGTNLVSTSDVTINGVTRRVFTVKKTVSFLDSSGVNCGTLYNGDQIATYTSTTGVSNRGHMIFDRKKSASSSTWTNLLTNGADAFVDLGLSYGSEPSNRAIW